MCTHHLKKLRHCLLRHEALQLQRREQLLNVGRRIRGRAEQRAEGNGGHRKGRVLRRVEDVLPRQNDSEQQVQAGCFGELTMVQQGERVDAALHDGKRDHGDAVEKLRVAKRQSRGTHGVGARSDSLAELGLQYGEIVGALETRDGLENDRVLLGVQLQKLLMLTGVHPTRLLQHVDDETKDTLFNHSR